MEAETLPKDGLLLEPDELPFSLDEELTKAFGAKIEPFTLEEVPNENT